MLKIIPPYCSGVYTVFKQQILFLKLGTINVHHKRNKLNPLCCCHSNYFGSSLLLSKNQISPFTTSKVRQKGPTWNRHSSHVVVTAINWLCGVDGSWLRRNLGISVFIKTAPVSKLLSWQLHLGFHWASFVMGFYGAQF